LDASVKDFEGSLERRLSVEASTEHGPRVAVTFLDEEVLEGTTLSYSPKGLGFLVTPLEADGNNVRSFVASGALRHVSFPEN
jgi:phage head maturation protease